VSGDSGAEDRGAGARGAGDRGADDHGTTDRLKADAVVPEADDDAPRRAVERPVAERLGLTPGPEVVRAALNRARAAAQARGVRPGQPGKRRVVQPEQRSGPGRDGRDPVLLGDLIPRIASERGWSGDLQANGVIARWREIVGEQVADHTEPESFDDGVLVIRADQTSWAQELRLQLPRLRELVEAEVGRDGLTEIRVLGPAGPHWVKGKRRVAGRGPRDTYG
jgi:predicted nucleic acid-binding Zn ribbon protein